MSVQVIRSTVVRGMALFAICLLALSSTPGSAQTRTTGAIEGTITDSTGEPVADAVVVATSLALQGRQSVETGDDGQYHLGQLPPGRYTVTVHLGQTAFTMPDVQVRVGKLVEVDLAVDTSATTEVVEVEARSPLIDQGSTKTGVTLTEAYARHIPSSRSFAGLLEVAPGAQGDLYGTSFGGSTSPESVFLIDGLDVTDPTFGTLEIDLPTEFIEEMEVISGGYAAEYGRSTGGVVNVVTKSGGNEVHGTVFSYVTPGVLSAAPKPTPRAGSALSGEDELALRWELGAEVGGPILKDRVWFHLGVNPVFQDTRVHRIISTQVDADQDGVPDTDANGFRVMDELTRSTGVESTRTMLYTGKITAALTPDHRLTLSVFGDPGAGDNRFSVAGEDSATWARIRDGSTDVVMQWTSMFHGGRTVLEATGGWHRFHSIGEPLFSQGNEPAVIYQDGRPLTAYSDFESEPVPRACRDGGPRDPYPEIVNCPVDRYRTGGTGFTWNEQSSRFSSVASISHRLQAAGQHTLKAGVDLEHQTLDNFRSYTGGTLYVQLPSGVWIPRRFFTVKDGQEGVPCGSDIDGDGVGEANCVFQEDGLLARSATRNLGLFVQDSWQPLPNLTLNAGLRYDQQTIFNARDIVGETSPTTGQPIADKALVLDNQFGPRIGAIFDPTNQGYSRIFGHWGRFYEAVPMDINDRAYGGEVLNINVLLPGMCDDADPVGTCPMDDPFLALYFGGGDEMAAPGLGGQYLDELVVGGELQLLEGFKVGATFTHRTLGRVIEDVSTDGAATYIIANPGEVDEDAIAELREQAEQARANGNDARADFLEFQATMFEGVATFDRPRRTYDALMLTAEKQFGDRAGLMASYTFSRLFGNYPGLFSPETGQLDPNLTSMYDLPELMANRYGPLAADRPHQIKVDGYYGFPVEGVGAFLIGGRFRARSGRPINTLGAHALYGPLETYILPRGSGGRTPFVTRIDLRLGYGRPLDRAPAGEATRLEVFVDAFNVLNSQPPIRVDEEYTRDAVNPIVGGSQDDLEHLKAIDPGTGLTGSRSATVNPNYGNPQVRQAPRSFRIGARIRF